MTEEQDKPFCVQAVSPRFKGAMMGDAAKALMRPPI